MEEDYYTLLGVHRHASKASIKKAYKEMALRWHPDKNPDDYQAAHEMFQKISNAYKVLMNEKERKQYDLGIKDGAKRFYRSDTPPPHSSFDDLYESFYGNQSNTPKNNKSSHPSGIPHPQFRRDGIFRPKVVNPTFRAPKSSSSSDDEEYVSDLIGDNHIKVMVTLDEIFTGCQKQYVVTRYRDNQIENKTCVVRLPPGIEFGRKIVIKGQGNKCIGHEPHDIIFTVTEIPHKNYTRQENDVHTNYLVGLKQALLGFDIEVKSIDGIKLKTHVYGPIHEGFRHVFRNMGLPIEGTEERGNLVVNVKVNYPKVLSDEERECIIKYLPE